MYWIKVYGKLLLNSVSMVMFTLVTFILMVYENYPLFIALPIILLAAIVDGICTIHKELISSKSETVTNVTIDKIQTNNPEEFVRNLHTAIQKSSKGGSNEHNHY